MRAWLVIALFLGTAAAAPAWAQAPAADPCKDLRAARDARQADYDRLAAYKLPSEEANDLRSKLAFVRTLLADTSKDASERAKQIADYVEKARKADPSDPRAAAALKSLADYAEKVGKGVGDAAEKMAKLNAVLDKADGVLATMQDSFAIAESGSAADQLNDFKAKFDAIRERVPGIDEIPGLGQMLDIYSEAIGRIAQSVAQIEAEVKRRNEIAGDAAGDDGKDPLYLRIKGQREQLADRRKAASEALAAAEAALEAQGCNQPKDEPASREDVARRICMAKCGGPGLDWRRQVALAQDLEDAAASSADAAKRAASTEQDAAARTADVQARLDKVQSGLDDYYRRYRQQPGLTTEQIAAGAQGSEASKADLIRQAASAKDTLTRAQSTARSTSLAAARDAARAQAARGGATRLQATYDRCRLDCFQNAVAGGDIPELPSDVAAPPCAGGGMAGAIECKVVAPMMSGPPSGAPASGEAPTRLPGLSPR